MSKKTFRGASPPSNNPVAKFAGQFNRATVFADRTRYRRKPKHQGREPCLIGFYGVDNTGLAINGGKSWRSL